MRRLGNASVAIALVVWPTAASAQGMLTRSELGPDVIAVEPSERATRSVQPASREGAELVLRAPRQPLPGDSALPGNGERDPLDALRQQALQAALSTHFGALELSHSLGFEPTAMMEGRGEELEIRTALGFRQGAFLLHGEGALGRAFGERQDVDFESSARLALALGDRLAFGAESRLRFELADADQPGDVGREYELVSGPAAYVSGGPFTTRALVGWMAPRGLAQAGPIAMAALGGTF